MTTRKNRNGDLLSRSSYGSVRSALKYLFKVSGFDMKKEFEQDMAQFSRGIKRQVAEERAKNGKSLDEGKRPMTFECYKLMCNLLIKSDSHDSCFAHLFLILDWNLMARADSCRNILIAHIEWRQDSLLIFFAKSKGNQTGETSDTPWHIYSNPTSPALCPVLALARYLLSHPDIITKKRTKTYFLDQTSTIASSRY